MLHLSASSSLESGLFPKIIISFNEPDSVEHNARFVDQNRSGIAFKRINDNAQREGPSVRFGGN